MPLSLQNIKWVSVDPRLRNRRGPLSFAASNSVVEEQDLQMRQSNSAGFRAIQPDLWESQKDADPNSPGYTTWRQRVFLHISKRAQTYGVKSAQNEPHKSFLLPLIPVLHRRYISGRRGLPYLSRGRWDSHSNNGFSSRYWRSSPLDLSSAGGYLFRSPNKNNQKKYENVVE